MLSFPKMKLGWEPSKEMGCVVSRRKIHDCCTVDLTYANYEDDSRQKCANYVVCQDMVSESVQGKQNSVLCRMCDQLLGKLLIRKSNTKTECCICLNDHEVFEIKMDCGQEHWVCQDCFAKPLQTDYLVLTKKTIMVSFARLGWRKTVQLVNLMTLTVGKQKEILRTRLNSLMRCPLCRGKSPWGRVLNPRSDDEADDNLVPIVEHINKKKMRQLLLFYHEATDIKVFRNEAQKNDVEMQAMWSPS